MIPLSPLEELELFQRIPRCFKDSLWNSCLFYGIVEMVYIVVKSDGNNKMTDKIVFQKLTPTDTVDLAGYKEAFDFIFSNDDILNVAISGAYGSGKSSVLETYKKKQDENEKKQFLHISLAHFSEDDSKGDYSSKAEENTSIQLLEGKILNQLIQQAPESDIALTNFHVKREYKKIDGVFWSILTTIMILIVVFFSKIPTINSYLYLGENNLALKQIACFLLRPVVIVLCTGVLSVIGALFIYNIIKIQKNRQIFRKLNMQGTVIEMFSDSEASYFDKYLNEILYLLEKMRIDVVVFEDIDRFDRIKIFERLREINRLANIRRSEVIGKEKLFKRFKKRDGNKKTERVLRFFYLLRDDLITGRDRTKFFDFVMPVVPVIDGSNSYNKLKDYLEAAGVLNRFDRRFLQKIMLYIDDLRMVKNIVNEYLIYDVKIGSIDIIADKLFAMIAYKNLFPRDFSNLQLRQGYIFDLFAKKATIQNKKRKELEEEKQKIEQDIQNATNEMFDELQELNAVKADRRSYPTKYKMNTDFQTWDGTEYPKRKTAIENKKQERLSELARQSEILRRQLLEHDGKRLCELLTEHNDYAFFTSLESAVTSDAKYADIFASSYFDLVVFLIREGYIDETYADYITFFYENSITKKDKIFLRSVVDRKPLDQTRQINNPDMVLEVLSVSDFLYKGVRNFDLIEYVFLNDEANAYAESFITQLQENRDFEFISDFTRTERCNDIFILKLCNRWIEFLSHLLSSSNATSELKALCISTAICQCDKDIIMQANIDNCLTHYISNKDDFLDMGHSKADRIIENIATLDVRFVAFAVDRCNGPLLERVYHRNLYILNKQNILLFLSLYYNSNENEDILTRIFSDRGQPLYTYVTHFLNDVIDEIVSGDECEIHDDEAIVLELINDENVSLNQKLNYIACLKTIVGTITDVVEVECRQAIVKRKLMTSSPENIFAYYKQTNTLTDELAEFINSSTNNLDFNGVLKEENEQLVFFHTIIATEQLSKGKYRELVKNIGTPITNISGISVPVDRIDILIEEMLVPMTPQNLHIIRTCYSQSRALFISINIEDYSKAICGNSWDNKEAADVLEWESVSENHKVNILKDITEAISIVNRTLPLSVFNEILSNHFHNPDFLYLCEKYSTFDKSTQDIITKKAKDQLSVVVSQNDLNASLLRRLISENIPEAYRQKLLIMAIERFDDALLAEALEDYGVGEIGKIFMKRRQADIKVNNKNQAVLQLLLDYKRISGYSKDDNNTFYVVTRTSKKIKKNEGEDG